MRTKRNFRHRSKKSRRVIHSRRHGGSITKYLNDSYNWIGNKATSLRQNLPKFSKIKESIGTGTTNIGTGFHSLGKAEHRRTRKFFGFHSPINEKKHFSEEHPLFQKHKEVPLKQKEDNSYKPDLFFEKNALPHSPEKMKTPHPIDPYNF